MRETDFFFLLEAEKDGGGLRVFSNVWEGDREVERSRETPVRGGGREGGGRAGDCISSEK